LQFDDGMSLLQVYEQLKDYEIAELREMAMIKIRNYSQTENIWNSGRFNSEMNFYLGQYFFWPAIFSAILNANAEIVSDRFTPNGVGIIEPSTHTTHHTRCHYLL
jgi:hypothetical protein